MGFRALYQLIHCYYYHKIHPKKLTMVPVSDVTLCNLSKLKFCGISTKYIKSNLSLYSMYYGEARNQFMGPIIASLARATQLLSKKCRSSGEPFATLRSI